MSFNTYQRLLTWARGGGASASVRSDDRHTTQDQSQRPCAVQELEPRHLLSAVLTTAIPDQHLPASGGTASINLTNFFDDTDIPGTVVRYDIEGFDTFDVELLDLEATNTVLNFLGYVDRGDFDGTFFHRLALNADNTPFVLQGGGFEFTAPNNYDPIFQGPPVVNEFGRSNLRGTLAMAKVAPGFDGQGNPVGGPDSATNQSFFNMGDNSANLDNQNGGFTVFGQVLGNGMAVVDLIAQTPVWNANSLHPAFTDLPLRNQPNGDPFPNDRFPDDRDLVTINSITRVEELSYKLISSSAPSRVVPTVSADGQLTLITIGSSVPETVTVTVEAEDHDGNTTQATITVEVGPAKESLNGDKFADLVWRNFKTGKDAMWEMTGFDKAAGVTALKNVNNTTWYIAAVGDFNKDGHNDLFWRNAFDGQNKVWLMNGSNFVSVKTLRTVPNQNLSVGGLGDINNDGNIDILWRNAKNGRNVAWTMDGTAEMGSLRLDNQPGKDWYIGGLADLDRDGAVDVLWRNDSGGQNKAWLLNPVDGTLKQAVGILALADTSWVMTGVADYSAEADNRYDILYRNVKTGKQQAWVMNGTSRLSVNNDIPRLKNQDWQLPGRASQLAARGNALAKIQRQANRTARVRSAALVAATSTQSSESTASLLGSVEPIFTLDIGADEPGTAFTLGDDGQVVN